MRLGILHVALGALLGMTMFACHANNAREPNTPFDARFETETEPRSREGFAAALRNYDAALQRGANAAELNTFAEVVARQGAQRDAHVSRLYWQTDLGKAVAEAHRLGRPIVSLRMLGRLDEELSCANSRFFRTTLYSNPAVAQWLRDNVVLHWSMERPAPKMTIDFGDGRKVVRTVTGNSIHYVLDSRGRPVDALPGLYSADAFLAELRRLAPVANAASKEDDAKVLIATHHAAELARQSTDFAPIALAAGIPDPNPPGPLVGAGGRPAADVAMPIAMPKAATEASLVAAAVDRSPNGAVDRPAVEQYPWERLARGRAPTHVDPTSRALMRTKSSRDWTSADPKPLDERGFAAMVASFEQLAAVDTLKNEYGLRRTMHVHMRDRADESLNELNAFTYSVLFLTPAQDPWLGLTPARAYTGIPDDGLLPASR